MLFHGGMLNSSLRIEHILAVTLKKRKDEASPFHPLHYQRITVDDHERGLIVFTAGPRQIEGISLLAHPSLPNPALPICLVFGNRHQKAAGISQHMLVVTGPVSASASHRAGRNSNFHTQDEEKVLSQSYFCLLLL